jgi:hypothetical protein
MVAGNPRIYSALNFFMHAVLSVSPKYLEFATVLKI